jgi:carboxyl-terminal processing protease
LRKDTKAKYGGVGIVISVKDNYLTVVAPMDDTPAFRAGILSGDRIIKIDGKSAEKLSRDDGVKRLRGEPGTQVKSPSIVHRPIRSKSLNSPALSSKWTR